MAEKDEESKGEEAATAAKPAGKSKTLLIVGGVVALIVLVGAPVAFLTLKGGSTEEGVPSVDADAAKQAAGLVPEGALDEDELEEGEEPLGAILPLESFVVNLSGGRFIRLQAQIEFVGRDVPRRFYARVVPIRDRMIHALAAKTAEQLLQAKGRDTLRQEFKEIVNEILRKEEAKQVYFTQYVIQ